MNDVDSLINQGFVLSNVNNNSTNQPKPLENNSVFANGIKELEVIAKLDKPSPSQEFYYGVILKAYGGCDPGDEPKHFWVRFEDENRNYKYYQFPITENPIGYQTRLTKENEPKSRETTGKAIALFNLLQDLSSKSGNGITFIPSCPPYLPLTERFNGSRIINFEIDGASLESQWELINEMVNIGLKPTAIINSGNKSLHPCFVISDNLTADQFRYLKRSFLPFGCDENVANSLIGGMRFPGVTRQSTGREQSLESLNDVTYSFSELTRLVEFFYFSKGLDFESFEKYQARREIESEKLRDEAFSLNDYNLSDIESLLTEWDQLFPPYQSGNQTYNYRKNMAIAIASMGLGNKAKELCPNLFSGTNIKFSSLEKFKFNNPLGCILSQSRKWLNDNDLQYPDCFKVMYQTQKNNLIQGKFTPNRFNSVHLLDELKELLEKGISGSELLAEKTAIAKKHGLIVSDIEKQYQALIKDCETEEDRQDTKAEVLSLFNAQNKRLDISSVLPEKLAEGLKNRAELMHLRPECFLTSLLAGLSSVCNPKTKVILNKDTDFKVNAGLYAGLVAISSQKKSPIINTTITRPLFTIQSRYQAEYQEKLKDYENQLDRYETLKKQKKTDDLEYEFPDGPPVKPTCENAIVSDTTGEALKAAIASQKKGVILTVDELAGLFKAANQYRGGKGSDIEDLLSLYDGVGFNILRKSGSCFVEQALLSVFGSIQPGILKQMLGDGKDSNGQWARFIWVEQPLTQGTLPRDGGGIDIDPMIDFLYEGFLTHATHSSFEHTYTLSRQGFLLFADAYDDLEKKRYQAGESPMGSVYGKSEGRIGKLAIVLHLVKHIFNGQAVPNVIEADTVHAAIALTDFYINQVLSLYGQLTPDDQALAPHLLKVIDLAKRLGEITPRDVNRARIAKDSETVKLWFRELEAMGLGSVTKSAKSLKFTASVTSVTSVTESVTVKKALSSKVSSLSVTSVTTNSNFSNLSPNPSVETLIKPDTEISTKENVTVVTDEAKTFIQQGLRCVTSGVTVVTDETTENTESQAQQGIQPSVTSATHFPLGVTHPVTDTHSQVFVPGDRVKHSRYGLGTMESQVKGEWYCRWDEFEEEMQLIPEDFELMKKIA